MSSAKAAFLVLLGISVCANGSSAECSVINHYYGLEAGPVHGHNSSGRPGKAGPRGPRGPKGDAGKCPDCDRSYLDALEFRVDTLESQLRTLEQQLQPRVARSCAAMKNRTAIDSGMYLISPDSLSVSPFYVYCNFTDANATTSIGHDSENEMHVPKCATHFCHRHDVVYDVTNKQIRSLVKISSTCRQYIKYRCRGSILMRNLGDQYAAWISPDGRKMSYWGGSTTNGSCACGETGTCLNTNYKCNCDENGETSYTADEGYLVVKGDLPVAAMLFGDTDGGREDGWFTLGKLDCSGLV